MLHISKVSAVVVVLLAMFGVSTFTLAQDATGIVSAPVALESAPEQSSLDQQSADSEASSEVDTTDLAAEPADAALITSAHLIGLAILLLILVSMWKIFEKAGQSGWKSIVPVYGFVILLRITGRSGWWVLLMLIPIVSFIYLIFVYRDLARTFGKGAWFTMGLLFLPFIFYPVLAFGNAKYTPIKKK